MNRKKLRTALRERILQETRKQGAVKAPESCPTCPYRFDPLIDRKEAAAYMGFEPETLSVWDCTKAYDLQPIKFKNVVRYRLSSINRLADLRIRRE